MRITKFQVLNFKSFRDSNEIELKPGFNVITGQNSGGKTALLEAMTFRFTPNPHRSLRTIPAPGGIPPQECVVRATFSLTREELFSFLGPQNHLLPQPPVGFVIPGDSPYQTRADEATAFLNWLSQESEFLIELVYKSQLNMTERWQDEGIVLGKYPAAPPDADGYLPMFTIISQDNRQLQFNGFARGGRSADLSTDVAPVLRTRIYRFSAERFNLGRSPFGNNSVLAPNAQNLPEALTTLQANPERFAQLNELLHEVLPQVRLISVRAIPNQHVQVIVWPHDPATQREDLAIPLDDCGSGVGQVIAILYVILTSDYPQVILVDELQSFLHPGAVRKLIDVLKRYPQHQYILTTHSPTVITAAEPATITISRANEGETSLHAIDPQSATDLRVYLSEIGARLSDVFGADNILWVEGQTEETCVPRVLHVLANRPLRGTAVVGIRQTGDLHSRDKVKMFELYRRLSSANSLMPPALAFVLDSECLSNTDKDNVTRASQRLARFLPRRMYENYLLNTPAIAAVANAIEGFRANPVQDQEVQALLDAKRTQLQYYCPGTAAVPADWIIHIHGARVIEEIFGELSEHRVSFEKTRHSVAITEWILEHCPEDLRELAEWLTGVLPAD
jgi:AAA domain, putative AbiEii toxin, Type IV TA system/AAA domain